jgi:hypothetical protein
VLGERWPALAARVVAEPSLIEELEGVGDPVALREALEARGVRITEGEDHLCELLRNQPRLSGVLTRLVHFDPSSAAHARGDAPRARSAAR